MKINYRRFERRRLMTIQASGFHTASFPVSVKQFQVTEAKNGGAKSFNPSIAPIRVIQHPIRAASGSVAHRLID